MGRFLEQFERPTPVVPVAEVEAPVEPAAVVEVEPEAAPEPVVEEAAPAPKKKPGRKKKSE